VVEAGGLLEAALQAVHRLEEALEAGKALGAEAGRRQIQQLLSAANKTKNHIHMFLSLPDPDPDLLVRGMNPDPDSHPASGSGSGSFYHHAKIVR
jgi:hypothetical protein